MSPDGARDSSYDVVVVGSGLGGLSTAAFLARAGRKVLVVERLDGPGGYAHAFRRGPYLFDPAVHAVGQGAPGLMLDTWLRALGVRDRVDLITLDRFYTVDFPGFRLNAPFGLGPFVAVHVEAFPHEEAGIREFMEICRRVRDERDVLAETPARSFDELARAASSFSTLLRYRTATVQEVLDECISDPRAKSVLAGLWSYQGAPPDRLSFVVFAGMLVSLTEGGQSYCRGSFQSLVDAFVAALEADGGELLLGTRVARIALDDGAVAGVELEGGTTVAAPVVVANADATQTLLELVGREHLPARYLRRLERMRPGTSAFVIYATTTLEVDRVDVAHETFVFGSWDHAENFAKGMAGEPAALAVTAPTVVDPSLAPPGEHIVTVVALMSFDGGVAWRERKERTVESVLQEVERVLPGLGERLVFAEGATPLAMHHYSLNRDGAIYGWENSPEQSFSRRLANKTPIPGLYLASAWAQPGSGTVGVMQSGFQTAQIILGHETKEAFLAALGFAPESPVT